MDLQFVLDPCACAMYVTSYLCEADRNMSELLRAANEERDHTNIRDKVNKLGNVFLNHRELTLHEALYKLLSIPLKQSSRSTLFLSTNYPENQSQILKSKEEIAELSDDSTMYLYISTKPH